jgi:heme/copper-type cytochrome/quinol oxidase subunit 2
VGPGRGRRGGRVGKRWLVAAAALLAGLSGTALAGEDTSLFRLGPDEIGVYGGKIDTLYVQIMWLTTIVFLLTEGALVLFLFRFRAKAGGKAVYTHGNHRLEVIWTILPGVLLFLLAILQMGIWKDIKIARPDPKGGLVVQVLAKQFEWHFRYAGPDGRFGTEDDVVTTNYLHVPVNTNVTVLLRSQDVLHSFFLPNVRLKQDTVPGMTIPQWFNVRKTTEQGKAEFRARLEADRANLGSRVARDLRAEILARLKGDKRPEGDLDAEYAKAVAEKSVEARTGEWIDGKVKAFEFEIACAELCGIGHTTMRGFLRVYPEKEFFAWINKVYEEDVHEDGTDPDDLINKNWPASQNKVEDAWLREKWPAELKAAWPKKGE